MLSPVELASLSVEDLLTYEGLTDEEKKSFEYFYGFAYGQVEQREITNEEIKIYQDTTDKIRLKTVWQLVNRIPHRGQQPIIYTFDECADTTNSYVTAAGRRFGKSFTLESIALRELLVPYSATILVAPTFSNAKVIFNGVLKLIHQLQLPIEQINKGQFNFTLENGARFTANSSANIESALGGHFSLALYEESQSIANLDTIHKQMIAPTHLDYGVRPSGILYARQFFIGTSRGVENQLYDYFIMEEAHKNYKSFTAPSYVNPTLPKGYFAQMKLELGDMLYAQEIEAKFIGSDDNIFFAFDEELNTYEDGSVTFTKDNYFIVGIDIGWSDSTAAVYIYRTSRGYYIEDAYSKNFETTENHVIAYREKEQGLLGEVDMRFGDPAAAQTLNDYNLTYDYFVSPAKNDRAESIAHINMLFSPSGVERKPRLFINKKLEELIRQVKRIRRKSGVSLSAKDPFIKDSQGTHWDLIAALRYAIYSDKFNSEELFIATTSR